MPIYWIWFAELADFSVLQKHRLLEHFHDPEEIYHASGENLKALNLTEKQLQSLQKKDLTSAAQIVSLCRRKGIGVLPFCDVAYPKRLANTPDAPIVLYYNGILG